MVNKEIEQTEIRKSTGDGSDKDPYTYGESNDTTQIIKEAARLSWLAAMKGELVHLDLNGGKFAITHHAYANSKTPAFEAKNVTPKNHPYKDRELLLRWATLAVCTFTLQAIKEALPYLE